MSDTDSACLFCKIITGEIPCEKIFEDVHTFAFLDIHPVNHGHTLVIPKEHHADIFSIPAETFASVMKTAHLLAPRIKEAVGADGINIGMNNGGAAGQMVFHAHVHVIPRFSEDGHRHWLATTYGGSEIGEFGEKIRSSISEL